MEGRASIKPIFVGIDPGVSTAIAILDLEGNLIAVKSEKGLSKEDIDKFIIEHGKPLVVASDTPVASALVRRIAATFGAKLYSCKDTSLEEKKKFVEERNIHFKDPHSYDATFAAFSAFQKYAKKIREIRSKLKKLNKEHLFFEVIEKAMKIDRSVDSILSEFEEKGRGFVKKERNWKKLYLEAKQELKKKDAEIKELKKFLRRLEIQNIGLSRRIKGKLSKAEINILKGKIIHRKELRLKEEKKRALKLEKEIITTKENLKRALEFIEKLMKGWIPAKRIFNSSELNDPELRAVFITKEMEGEQFPPNIEIIICENPRKVTRKSPETLLFDEKNIEMVCFEDFCAINPKSIGGWKERFLNWLKEYRGQHV